MRIAGAVAREAVVPDDWDCCAFAGDRGMLHPQLTESATAREAAAVAAGGFDAHASCNRTCEIGMSRATGAGSSAGSSRSAAKSTASTSRSPAYRGSDATTCSSECTSPSVQEELSQTTGSSPSREAAQSAAIDALVAQHGRLDILVNNAGIGAAGRVEDNDDEEWQRVYDVNVLGIARLTRAALPHLRRSPSAAIVNTGSVAATMGLVNRAVYSATKGAVEALTRAMAADLIPDGIRVNAVAPGTADTPWVQRLLDAADDPAAARAALVARQPIGRLISADEVAHGVCYLASPRSGSTTGIVLAIDGGLRNIR